MSNLIEMKELNEQLNAKDVVIVDCRYNLMDKEAGRQAYNEDHIPGAYYFDLAEDLSGESGAHGGRHPLPRMKVFLNRLESIGIDETKHVIAYDDQNGPFAARLWWMLKYVGHDKVSVLNANYTDWKKQGFETTNEVPVRTVSTFTPRIQTDMIINIKEVKKIMNDQTYALIDARAKERYKGEVEPLDAKAGHIPGAKNYFWEETKENSQLKSPEALASYFSKIKDKEVVVYCGSGVTGSVNVLALDEIGKKAKLYPGGWSDWSSYKANKVATKK